MTTPPRISVSPAQIGVVLRQFYARVRADPDLGPVFAEHVSDWRTHEEMIGRFWRRHGRRLLTGLAVD